MRRGTTKKWAQRAALVFLTLLAGVLCAALAAPPTVRVRGGNTFEAGSVGRGIISHTFVLFNPHPFPVRLWLPPPEGCTCLTVHADRAYVAAFGTAKVTVQKEGGAGEQTEGARFFTGQANRQAETWVFLHTRRAPK